MFTQRVPSSYGAVDLSVSLLKPGGGGLFPEIAAGRGPHQSRCELVRADARSLRVTQRVISGFVQALDFGTAEALTPDLKPCAEGWVCVGPQRRNEGPQPLLRTADILCGCP